MKLLTPASLLLAFVLACDGAQAQPVPLTWKTDLASARADAAASGRKILLFFSAPKSMLSEHFEKIFTDPAVQTSLSSQCVIVRFPLNDFRSFAAALQVFKAGTVVVCDASAQPLDRISEPLEPAEFLQRLQRPSSMVPTPSATTAVPAAEPRYVPAPPVVSPTPRSSDKPPVPTAPPPPPLPLGRLIQGPMVGKTNIPITLTLDQTRPGEKYVLVIEGTWNPWGKQNPAADAMMIFNRPTAPGQLEYSNLVRIERTTQYLFEYVQRTTGSLPPYNPTHRYEVIVEGKREPLRLYFLENGHGQVADNTGELTFSLYELKSNP